MAETSKTPTEHDILVMLNSSREINGPWLENQAVKIEEALAGCTDVLGPSVTANFEKNGWELDLTILAVGGADAYDKLSQVFKVVEEVAGIEFATQAPDEVHSGYESHQPAEGHETGKLQPA